MYGNDEYENEQDIKTSDNFIVNFYYNNKILIWILVGVIAFILLMSLLTRGGTSTPTTKSYNVTILPEKEVEIAIGNSYPLTAKVEGNDKAAVEWSSEDENVAKVINGTVTAVGYGKTKIWATYIHSAEQKYSKEKEITVADGNKNLTLTDVSFTKGDLLMPVNGTYDISLNLTPSNGYVTNKEFTSTDTSIVTVDNKGHVVAVGEGTARINLNVNNGAFRRELKVFVSKEYTQSEIIVNPEKIDFDGELIKMKIGTREKLRYTITPTNADTTRFVWTSSDESVVTVDKYGYIKAEKEGTAKITVTAINGLSDTIDIEVETDIIPVTGIEIAMNEIDLVEGETRSITPIVSPSDASNKVLSYFPGDTSIITVEPNQTGTSATIYALREGTTTLTISSINNVEKKLTVVVTKNGNGNDFGGNNGGGSSTQGFTISSQDANYATNKEGFIVTSYNATKNNEATAPVKIIVTKTDSSISKLMVIACTYPADSSCDPQNGNEVSGTYTFTMRNNGTYVIRVGKYNSSGNEIGVVDKYIAIKGGDSTKKDISSLTRECSSGNIVIKDGSKTLTQPTDYKCSKTLASSTQFKFTCEGKGNYTGTFIKYCTKTSGDSTVTCPKCNGTVTCFTAPAGATSVTQCTGTVPAGKYISCTSSGCTVSDCTGNTYSTSKKVTYSSTLKTTCTSCGSKKANSTHTGCEDTVTCSAPTNLKVNYNGIVSWTNSSTATSYEISFDNSNWSTAYNSGNYLGNITGSYGERTVYIRSVCSGLKSSTASKKVNVYKISTHVTTGVSKIDGWGNYIEGYPVKLTAKFDKGYTFNYWTQGGVRYSKENPLSFNASSNLDLYAFAQTSGGSSGGGSTDMNSLKYVCEASGDLSIYNGSIQLVTKDYCKLTHTAGSIFYYYKCTGSGKYTGTHNETCTAD